MGDDTKRRVRRPGPEGEPAPPPVDEASRGLALFLFLPIAFVAWLMALMSLAADTSDGPWAKIQVGAPIVGLLATAAFVHAKLGGAGRVMRFGAGGFILLVGASLALWVVADLFTGQQNAEQHGSRAGGRALVFAVVIMGFGAQVVRSGWSLPAAAQEETE